MPEFKAGLVGTRNALSELVQSKQSRGYKTMFDSSSVTFDALQVLDDSIDKQEKELQRAKEIRLALKMKVQQPTPQPVSQPALVSKKTPDDAGNKIASVLAENIRSSRVIKENVPKVLCELMQGKCHGLSRPAALLKLAMMVMGATSEATAVSRGEVFEVAKEVMAKAGLTGGWQQNGYSEVTWYAGFRELTVTREVVEYRNGKQYLYC